ncbi:MAG TPA: DMT family transporter [Hyphomonadaceae bacterium]|nr:DMT family transporter [Hyphomonadaceae bacterium]HPN06320.1 DMT family transporter [Hyphomonadaceae bacterium]
MRGQAADAATRPSRRLTGNGLSWAALILLVVIWGSTFAGVRIGVETISPAWLVTGRMLSGAFFLGCWIVLKRALDGHTRAHEGERVTGKAIGWFVFIGIVATAIPFVMYAHAAETVGSAVMAICNGGTPFATVLLAHAFTTDKLSLRRMIGVMMGFAGLVVLVLPEFGADGGGSLFGILLAIFGAWLYAIGNVATRMAPRIEPAMSSFFLIGTGGLATLAYATISEPFPTNPSVASITAMIILGLLPTAFAMFVYVWLIQRAGPVFVSFTTYMSPLWATGLGVMFLGEHLHWSMIGALGLILAGVAVANARRRSN